MEPIHLVAATNEKYAVHLGVMLASLMANKNSKRPIRIYILNENLSDRTKLNLKGIAEKKNAKVQFISIKNSVFDTFKVRGYIGKEMYYRISIPEVLDKNINKVLYLDCDIVVMEDITKLWKTKIDDYCAAAVGSVSKLNRAKSLSIPKSYGYFNSGVMLINLKKWREHRITPKVIDYIKNNREKLIDPDQDALNAVLYDKWLKLDPKWNFTTNRFNDPEKNIKPAIIHFTGKRKPWNFGHPMEKEYHHYRKTIKWVRKKADHGPA